MVLSNDTRGWIMTCMSGIACTLGASVICVDLIIRLFPGKRNFKIQDSDAFLSSSLSLSFGVMFFSSLYSMLPSSKKSLESSGLAPRAAAWTLIGCFLAGVIGIQILSRVLHHFIPSHVVDCEHSHDEEAPETRGPKDHVPDHDYAHDAEHHQHDHPRVSDEPKQKTSRPRGHLPRWSSRPKHSLDQPSYFPNGTSEQHTATAGTEGTDHASARTTRRPSLHARLTSTFAQLTSSPKPSCDGEGSCYGFSEPCGQECFKIVQARGGSRQSFRNEPRHPPMSRSVTAPQTQQLSMNEATPLLQEIREEPPPKSSLQSQHAPDSAVDTNNTARGSHADSRSDTPTLNDSTSDSSAPKNQKPAAAASISSTDSPPAQQQHHHHVPTNAFLSIGLQTSIAIALHKLPEGFITYATNHANPSLGFAVFLALFIHNISEGFAMALPLYLALNSRWKAMCWSSLLGGFSQPLGAGIAALWFYVAKKTGDGNGEGGVAAPSERVYGCMFAVTAGIMASVALQLFGESLDLTHNRNLCMGFAFVGMGILGVSSALTA
ncbi:Zinc transporter [Elasticomyces elasticus]|nr:Zinc transporter [Elasticomyces elasticus]